jgi:mono/diheme cytochrome c family protein
LINQRLFRTGSVLALLALAFVASAGHVSAAVQNTGEALLQPEALIDQYCLTCHSQRARTAGIDLESLDPADPGSDADVWEKVVVKLRAGSMPPVGNPRPDPASYTAVAEALETRLDAAWDARPYPGRIGAVHRLNRMEYNNAIRDLQRQRGYTTA